MKAFEKSNYKDYSFVDEFNKIIKDKISGYNGKPTQKLKSFLEDMQKGGCISGMIGNFVYHHDCKEFYINHIDDMEEMKEELENSLGMPIENRYKLPHYTFICWLIFEEYCYNLYCNIFE